MEVSIKAKAQTTLEFTLCFVILVIIFFAAFKAFIWVGQTLAMRQDAYEASETDDHTASPEFVDFYSPAPINLIPKIASE